MPPKEKLKVEGMDQLNRKMDQLVKEVRDLNTNIMQAIDTGQQTGEETMASLDELKAEVEQNTNAVDSASRLINGLADQLEEALASQDPAAVQAVVDQLRSNNQALADAVAANTEVNPL